ncbi:MAG: adenylate/guanylate cyclase domain-containing protein [Kovacikia sp.]
MGPESDQQPSLQGQRTLAAIVFSDVVNFSGIMSADEENTLRLVQRDVNLMTHICEQYEGRVLKFTGDGLLMYFHSAVQAVACALEIQKEIAAYAADLSPRDVLQHRIGIHLGDVFVSDNDVMGDGVNIAARLQSEAEPGGICLSQIVYDVVKKRLALQATYLGPRELKHIQEAVPIYQIVLAASTKATTLSDDSGPSLPEPSLPEPERVASPAFAKPAPPLATSARVPDLADYGRKGLERLLTEKIGPIAAVILQQTLKQASSYQDLVDRLATHLPEMERFPFREAAHRLLKSEPDASEENLHQHQVAATPQPLKATPVESPSSSATAGGIDPEFVKQCELELTKAIGPIASLLVQRTLSQQSNLSRSQLVESLGKHLKQPEAIQAFYHTLLPSS